MRVPLKWVSRALKCFLDGEMKWPITDQYSFGLNISISDSRSHISRRATDWTRPAEREPGSLRQSTGDSENQRDSLRRGVQGMLQPNLG